MHAFDTSQKTVIGVMQPTFIPWMGYFAMMQAVDIWVVYDNVEVSRQSWQTRNRIRTKDGPLWISVPVTGSTHATIDCVPLAAEASKWLRKTLRTLHMNYRRAAAFDAVFPELVYAFSQGVKSGTLLGLNLEIIHALRRVFQITTPLVYASDMQLAGDRVGRLVEVCRHFNAAYYLSAPGAAGYLEPERPRFEESGVTVEYFRYDHPIYQQVYAPFMPYMGAVDYALNVGGPLP